MSPSQGRNPSCALPALVPQPHGGALYCSGVPGHVGGSGRPPSALRERLRGSLEARVSVLEEIADSPEADPADRIRAVDVLARYGLGAASDVTVDQVRERLGRTVALIRDRLPADLAGGIIQEMRGIWLT
jgi:hypothetical protein